MPHPSTRENSAGIIKRLLLALGVALAGNGSGGNGVASARRGGERRQSAASSGIGAA